MAVDNEDDFEPIPRLDTCCWCVIITFFFVIDKCCIQLKLGVLILCVLQMVIAGLFIAWLGSFILWGTAVWGGSLGELPLLGGAFTLLAILIILILQTAEFGFALYAFSDIRKAMPDGIRYYYMFKLVSLALSLLVFILTSDWTSYEIFNLFATTSISLYCIWCIWSLHEALMLGGEAAEKAGFTLDEASQNSPLLRNSRKADTNYTTGKEAAYV